METIPKLKRQAVVQTDSSTSSSYTNTATPEDSFEEPSETTPLVRRDVAEASSGRPLRLRPPTPPPLVPPGIRIPQSRGTSTLQAAMLMGSEMFGAGILVLPRAMSRTGWIGIPIIMLACFMAAFNGMRLSDCWNILETRNPELRTRKRNPYIIIVEELLGRKWGVVVSMALVVTQFGAGVVYLLLAADIVQGLLFTLAPAVNVCIWYLIIAGFMTPVALFIMPKDFIFLGFFSFFSAVVSYLLFFIALMNEIRPFVFRFGTHDFSEFFLGVGMIMFSFGGACSFPTIQNDMTDRRRFSKSLKYSFIVTGALYLAVAITGYAVLGDAAAPNFAYTLEHTSITLIANVVMIVHLVSAFLIFINPVCFETEMLYNVPRESLGSRVMIRLSIMVAIIFVGESIPRFYTILSLVGGTSIALLAFIIPCLCYLNINRVPHSDDDGSEPVLAPQPIWIRVLCWEVIGTGILACLLVTANSVYAMFVSSQATPCYLV